VPGLGPGPAAVGQTCCRTVRTVGRQVSAVATAGGFLAEAVGTVEVWPGTVEEVAWLAAVAVVVAWPARLPAGL